VLFLAVIRSITGVPVFLAISAGIAMLCDPGILLPKPPPVYSLMSTTSSGLRPTRRAMFGTVCAVLCVEPCR
jgi:hypothetical protein